MKLGIFTHYVPGTVDETARRIKAYGFETVQLNLEFADWRFADDSSVSACRAVCETFLGHGLEIAAIAGYVNPVAPDAARRQANHERLEAILARANELGSPYVVTETGSYHPDDDWAPHPDNATPQAFLDLRDAAARLTDHARRHGAVLLLEPSVGNIIDTPAKAQALMEEIASPALGLVADPANYVDDANLARADAVLRDMFARTAAHLRLAHAKDVRRIGGAPRERHHHMGDPALWGGMEYPSAGLGDLDYGLYLSLLKAQGRALPLIVEHLDEADVPRAKAFLDAQLMGPPRAA
jgi:sugar phosphate isomerase/epimerase